MLPTLRGIARVESLKAIRRQGIITTSIIDAALKLFQRLVPDGNQIDLLLQSKMEDK
jgi:hypothetical protein